MIVRDSLEVAWANVVIVARSNNPSLLNPDFLRINDLVPPEWDVEETLTTPPVAYVQFRNGPRVQVTEDRLEVRKNIRGPFPADLPVYGIASGYTKILKHVPYTAIGLNWGVSYICETSGSWLIKHFLAKEPWICQEPAPLSCKLTIGVVTDDFRCNLEFSPGKRQAEGELSLDAVVVNCNFHHQPDTPMSFAHISDIIGSWRKRQDFFCTQLDRFLFR